MTRGVQQTMPSSKLAAVAHGALSTKIRLLMRPFAIL